MVGRVTRIRFEEVYVIGVKHWKTPGGLRRRKTKKFMQTINPFNKNPDGTLKTREDIMKEIMAEREEWFKDGVPKNGR